MSAQIILLTPVDAWFFRDGRPYHQDSDQSDARSLFPPFAPTVVGAVRAALARERGWNGRKAWSEELNRVLGNGFDDLGPLRFSGPFLVRRGTCLFPAPLHLLGENAGPEASWAPSALLTPAENTVESDLGAARFPVPMRINEGGGQLKEPEGLWITAEGYGKILDGVLPDSGMLVHSDDLWRMESRVGLARDHETRSVKEGELYSPQYIRLQKEVGLTVAVEGIPDDWSLPKLVPFGGESRMADCDQRKEALPLPPAPLDKVRASGRFTVSLLTPLRLPVGASGRLSHLKPGRSFPGLPGSTIVSACVGKPVTIGGWDSVERRPLPLTPYLPAGSTWFCETEPDALDPLLARHGRHVGERTHYGFGQIILGAWPRKTGDTA